MLVRTFEFNRHYRVVLYLRMSSDQQNKRSPEQQKAEINRRLKALKLPWRIVKIYRDEAKSGRLLRKRKDYQRMMRELKAGLVQAELILVDTIERFGRVDEIPAIRKELDERYGILVLTADSNFADPNTPQGRALGMVEGYRASEDGRVKAHNVLRGKLDAVDQGHWPGSKPPFGFKVKHILGMVKDREEVLYSLLEHDSETAWIIKRLYQLAEDTGWGQTRLARALNDDPQIPAKYKPFLPATAGYWLDLPLYYGELVWPTHNTGIVDDARVLVPCKPDEIHRYPNFCKPIVDRKQWDTVQGMREAHRKHHSGGRRKKGTERLIVPTAPGLVLSYLLTGLVCCGHCHRAMTPSSSRGYTRKDGQVNRYASYVCPGFIGGHCPNGKRVPEEWLREVVIGALRLRFFS